MPKGIFSTEQKSMIGVPKNSIFNVPDITKLILGLLTPTERKKAARTCKFFLEYDKTQAAIEKQKEQVFYIPVYTPLSSGKLADSSGWKEIENLSSDKKLLLIPSLSDALEYVNSKYGNIGCYKIIISPAKLLSHPSCRSLGYGIYETTQGFPSSEIVSYIFENSKVEINNHTYKLSQNPLEQVRVEPSLEGTVEICLAPPRYDTKSREIREQNARLISIIRAKAGLGSSGDGGGARGLGDIGSSGSSTDSSFNNLSSFSV